MKLLESIKDTLYKQQLNKQLKQNSVDRKPTSFQRAKSIGFLLELKAEDRTDLDQILRYSRELNKLHKNVQLLAYTNTKTVPQGFDFDIFCQKDLNFKGIPKNDKVSRFIKEPFDILISFHTGSIQPLEYISGMSKAHCRIGYLRPDVDDFYDLILSPKNQTMEAYIGQIKNYLKIINKKRNIVQNESAV